MKRKTRAMSAISRARRVKALSVQQISEYLAGADMGYSKPAEIYDFPRPAHVLRYAHEIGLTPEQRAAAEDLLHQHKAEAREIGARFVDTECELEMLFRLRRVQPAGLASAVRRLARVESQYRLLHLETNRRMRALLSEEQVSRYAELRRRTLAEPTNPLTTMNGESR